MLQVALMFEDPLYDLDLIQADNPQCSFTWWRDCKSWDEERLAAACRSVEVVVTGRRSPPLPSALIRDRGRLRLLAHCHGTVKHLLDEEHLRAGLLVSNWGENVYGVAEGALALLLACLKQIPNLDRFVKQDWSDDQRIVQDFPATLVDLPVGLYGMGPIGRYMCRILQGLGANVCYYDDYASEIPAGARRVHSLQELFQSSSAVSIHCGLNASTRASVTGELLRLLPQGGILVNTARGPIVREAELAEVVREGRIVAAVDVIEDERGWAQSQLNHPNVIFSGHKIGSGHASEKLRHRPKRLPRFVVENLRALAAEEPLQNLIAPAAFALKT